MENLPDDARRKFEHYMYKVGEDAYESLPEYDRLPMDEWKLESQDPSMYMNHSCEPTCWFEWDTSETGDAQGSRARDGSGIVMTATRDLVTGDELTFDYATSEARPRVRLKQAALETRDAPNDCTPSLNSSTPWEPLFLSCDHQAGYPTETNHLISFLAKLHVLLARFRAYPAATIHQPIVLTLGNTPNVAEEAFFSPKRECNRGAQLVSSTPQSECSRASARCRLTPWFEDYDQNWRCRCGAPSCRGTVTGEDWRLPAFQQKHRGQGLARIPPL